MKNALFLGLFALLSCASSVHSDDVSSLTTLMPYEGPLYIQMNIYDDDHRLLKLSDGSVWILNNTYETFWNWYAGKDEQCFWLKPDLIEIHKSENPLFPYILVNKDRNQMVEARQVDPQVYFNQKVCDSFKKTTRTIDALSSPCHDSTY